ncbi:MAG: hemin uptake protein HemP [Pseudomonadota bacterium]
MCQPSASPQTPAGQLPASSTRPAAGRLDAAELFGERREVRIEHEGATYTLRLTRQNKLILTK